MRGFSKGERQIRASDLNHFFVGSLFTVDLPTGGELCGEIAALHWGQSGPIRVFLTVPAGPEGEFFVDLERDASVVVPLMAE